jgi:antitoxin component HigA of HigAB toxin-antitoxin module
MKAKILRTDDDYQAALARVESLMDAKPGSAKEEELELWSLLVERYEQEHFPIHLPDPVEATPTGLRHVIGVMAVGLRRSPPRPPVRAGRPVRVSGPRPG